MDPIKVWLIAVLGPVSLALALRHLGPRRLLALAVLLPISPILLLRCIAAWGLDLIDQAINHCGVLTRVWTWAASELVSGGRR